MKRAMFERMDTIVRCSKGHLFTTIWMPLGSLKAVRLGPRRYQRCPVGRHFALVQRVDPSELDPVELSAAQAIHDVRIP
jgi:hypothetical protein